MAALYQRLPFFFLFNTYSQTNLSHDLEIVLSVHHSSSMANERTFLVAEMVSIIISGLQVEKIEVSIF